MPKTYKEFKVSRARSNKNKEHVNAGYQRLIEIENTIPDHTGKVKTRSGGKMYTKSWNGRK